MAAKILVVDDEPSIVKLVTATLKARGYEVVAAYDGEEALDKAAIERPDLILLDIMMPKLNGRQARKKLLENPRTANIPVIHLSAIGDFENQLEAMQDGLTDYITKPFDPKELAERVARFLDPAERDRAKRETQMKAGKLRTIVDIMHRDHNE